jgi:hypothetical protein
MIGMKLSGVGVTAAPLNKSVHELTAGTPVSLALPDVLYVHQTAVLIAAVALELGVPV